MTAPQVEPEAPEPTPEEHGIIERPANLGAALCEVAERELRNPTDTSQRLELFPYQRELICRAFPPPPARPPRFVLASWPRKNAKTTTIAVICAAWLVAPWARDEWIVTAATGVRESETLIDRMRLLMKARKGVRWFGGQKLGARMKSGIIQALPAKAERIQSPIPTLVIVDEIGEQRDLTVWDALRHSLGNPREPTMFGISTRRRPNSPMNQLIAEHGGRADSLVSVYSADGFDDPLSDEAVEAANPGLGYIRSREELFEARDAARDNPRLRREFEFAYLNMSRPDPKAELGPVNVDHPGVSFGPCWVGVGSDDELIAVAVWWPASRALWHRVAPLEHQAGLLRDVSGFAIRSGWEMAEVVQLRDELAPATVAGALATPWKFVSGKRAREELREGIRPSNYPPRGGEVVEACESVELTSVGSLPDGAPALAVAISLAMASCGMAPELLAEEIEHATADYAELCELWAAKMAELEGSDNAEAA